MKQIRLVQSLFFMTIMVALMSSCKSQLQSASDDFIAQLDTNQYSVIMNCTDEVRHCVYYVSNAESKLLYHDLTSQTDSTISTGLEDFNPQYIGHYAGDTCVVTIAKCDGDNGQRTTAYIYYDTYKHKVNDWKNQIGDLLNIDTAKKTITIFSDDSISDDGSLCYDMNVVYNFDGNVLSKKVVGQKPYSVITEDDLMDTGEMEGESQEKLDICAFECQYCNEIKYVPHKHGNCMETWEVQGSCPQGNSHEWHFIGVANNKTHKFYCNNCGVEVMLDERPERPGNCLSNDFNHCHEWKMSY